MKRALLALALAVAAAFLPAQAQQPAPRIGLLLSGSRPPQLGPLLGAMQEALRKRGYSEAQGTVKYEYRFADGQLERLDALASELVGARVDLIFAGGDQSISAAQRATRTVPIVMVACDAVAAGLVTNLARPGGNLTGVTCINFDLAARRLQILRELLPGLARVGVILNPEDRRMVAELRETEKAGRALKVQVRPVALSRLADFGAAFDSAAAGRAEALAVVFDDLTFTHRQKFAEAATARRLPTIHNFSEYVDAGALLSYGPSLAGMWASATAHVEKILKGAKPGDLPIEQPTKFELVINLRTAKALGVTIPQSLLLRADRVVE